MQFPTEHHAFHHLLSQQNCKQASSVLVSQCWPYDALLCRGPARTPMNLRVSTPFKTWMCQMQSASGAWKPCLVGLSLGLLQLSAASFTSKSGTRVFMTWVMRTCVDLGVLNTTMLLCMDATSLSPFTTYHIFSCPFAAVCIKIGINNEAKHSCRGPI